MARTASRLAESPLPGLSAETQAAMSRSLRENLELIPDPQCLDASVSEVFQMMLGVDCRRGLAPEPAPPSADGEPETITAVVGFGGLLSGACVFHAQEPAALAIAQKLTAMEFAEIDDTVKDAIGEVCNMLAGVWKGRVPELAAHCGLSVPAVITGSRYNIRVQAPEFRLHHTYCFEAATFEVTILCDGMR